MHLKRETSKLLAKKKRKTERRKEEKIEKEKEEGEGRGGEGEGKEGETLIHDFKEQSLYTSPLAASHPSLCCNLGSSHPVSFPQNTVTKGKNNVLGANAGLKARKKKKR